jgi:hypothetical protein
MEVRRAARVRATLPVLYVLDRSDFTGTVVDISRTGAHIAAAKERVPEVGAPVRLFISGSRHHQVEIDGHTVRHTERGFATHFAGSTPVQLLELLVDLGGAPGPGGDA